MRPLPRLVGFFGSASRERTPCLERARVLEKLGMRLEAHFVENESVKDEWQSELDYGILDREWTNR